MRKTATYFAIFALSLAVILLEIAYTRIFSFKVYYYFTYLIIGLALLGLGAGGIFLSLSRRLRAAQLEQLVPACAATAGVLVAGGYYVLAPLALHVSALAQRPLEVLKVGLASLLLFLPFLVAGIAVTAILSHRSGEISRLYATDLSAAGLGCAVAVPLLIWLSPPGVVATAAVILVLAGMPLARSAKGLVIRHAPSAALLLVSLTLLGLGLPDPAVDPTKQLDDYRRAGLVVHSEWNPVFRIDVSKHPIDPELFYLIQHDGQLGSTLNRYNGDRESLGRFDVDARSYPFVVAPETPRVLIVGSAGGHEVLASLYFGAEHVTGVELNPATLELLRHDFAEYSGRLYENPRVSLVQGEARSFLKRQDQRYDLIWLVAPDSYAAMNASSSAGFVLAESYLYTAEMIRDSLERLTPHGVLCAQFGEINYEAKPNRTARFLRTARAALEETGIERFDRHVLVATQTDIGPLGLSTVLLSPSPFRAQHIERFLETSSRLPRATTRHFPGGTASQGPVGKVIELPESELRTWIENHPYDLDTVSDNRPFFWHFVRFRDSFRGTDSGPLLDWEDAIGERILLILLGLQVVLAAIFLLLPLLTVRRVWNEIPYKTRTALYFASVGMAFMLIEVCLIQMLTLFLGYPTYSLTVTLFALLVFAGAGSWLTSRYKGRRNRTLLGLVSVVALLILSLQLGWPHVVDFSIGSPLASRIAIAIGFIAPLGLCLGAFMPLGLKTVSALSQHRRQYLAWAWALNGFFSVITSILSTILAMAFGFQVVLLLGVVLYALATSALVSVPGDG